MISAHVENEQILPTDGDVTPPSDIVNSYLHAFYDGDFEAAGSLLTNDFAFNGPFVQVTGKDTFLESASGLRDIVHGHTLLRQWTDGNEVSSIYEVNFVTPRGAGAIVMAEWHIVSEGALRSGKVIFDSAAFRSLLSPA
jgi:hypothetical protein